MSRRNTELLYLLLASAMGTMAYVTVFAVREKEISRVSLIYGGVFLVIFLVLHLFVRRLLPQADPYLLPIAALLVATGLTEIYRIAPVLALKQGQWLLVGAVLFILTIVIVRDHRRLADYRYVIGGVGLLLLLVTAVFAREVNGARLWLHLGGFSIQPSEFAKLAIVVFLAAYLNDNKEMLSVPTTRVARLPIPPLKYFGPLLFMWVLSLLLLVFVGDFGMSLLFLATFVALLYMATGRLVYVVTGAVLFSGSALLAVRFVGHVHERFAIWIDPWKDASGAGYQLLQSLFAIADGGVLGPGFGRGYLLFADKQPTVPFLQTDFIFTAIANELGLVGAVGVILLFLLFCWRGFMIAVWAPDGFSKLLAAGLSTIFMLQAFIIIGGVTRLIPLTGITLPFVSYGGSSLTANMVLVALLLMVSQRTNVIRAGSATERLQLAELS